jgi:hypothetical protein
MHPGSALEFNSRAFFIRFIPNPLLTTPLHGGDKADGRWQMAEERKDFRQKGGARGGFGISGGWASDRIAYPQRTNYPHWQRNTGCSLIS